MLLKNKVYSGALQFTIFISVIIALLLAGIILMAYTHRYFIAQSRSIVENIQLSETGISALLLQDEDSPDTLSIKLPDSNENQLVKVNLSQWGIFEKAYVQAKHKKKQFIKCGLLGSRINQEERPALYLLETYKPLVVVGNTAITGKAFLPEQGVRTGNINGNSYYGSQLIYGGVQKSTTELPKLKNDYRQQLHYYLNEFQPQNSSAFIDVASGQTIINSFSTPVKGYFSEREIILDNVIIQGNIIIRSAEKIIIKGNAVLKDVILAAPEILIKDGVTGHFQGIADTSIKVGKGCRLDYPTALILLEKDNAVTNPSDQFFNKINIEPGSEVKGTICFFQKQESNENFFVNIFIGERTTIKGEIYCEGNLELKGIVKGTVYTNQFIANEGGTIFINHIYNGIINSLGFPEAFGGILFDNKSKSVMKWLY